MTDVSPLLAELIGYLGRWRTMLRLQAALSMLAGGDPVSRVAGRVGYDTPSAFVAAFRRETGQTPGSFFKP